MALDLDKLQKPLRKLRKSLGDLPRRPSPGQIHDLRTRSRRLEAIAAALRLDRKRRAEQLLEAIAPIRKIAGKVRDMDVLTGFASTLREDGEEECVVQLLEELGAKRFRFARKLEKTVAAQRKGVKRRLKRCARFLERPNTPKELEWPADAASLAIQLSGELSAWPRLSAKNLHPYRLKIKQLRYVLQLAGGKEATFIEALGEAKDAIGEWHDWSQLAAIADKVLNNHARCKLFKQIRLITEEKLVRAHLLTANMRKRYLHRNDKRRSMPPARPIRTSEAAIIAIDKLQTFK